MKNTIITLASVAALAGAANAQTVFSMQDPTMDASDFTLFETTMNGSTTSATGSSVSVATGGNAGSYLQVTNTFTNGSATTGNMANYWIRNGWSFDPSTLTTAEFANLTFSSSVDRKNDPNNHGTALFLRQGSTYYTFQYSSSSEANWANLSDSKQFAGLTQGGGVIQMGIASVNGSSIDGAQNYTAGYDNFSIVAKVPEPSSTALLGLGALGLIARRKR